MKIILRGGYNSTDKKSIENSLLFQRRKELLQELKEGKSICFVTAAKPKAGHYTERLRDFLNMGATEIGPNYSGKVEWESYDWIIVLGGDNASLIKKLESLDFSFLKLKETVTYIGDSAGTMIYSPFYYVYNKDGHTVGFFEGLGQDLKNIYIVHADNPWYVDDFLKKEVYDFADKNKLDVIEINENEEIILE